MRYRHTQVSYAMLVLQLALGLIILARSGSPAVSLVVNGLLVSFWFVFGRLTTTVSEGRVECAFGVTGWPRRSYPLRDVRSAAPIRTSPLAGWGMRLVSRGWLWNVWGLDAVELELANGQRFLIGTDEPHTLTQALRDAGVSSSARHAHDGQEMAKADRSATSGV